jgi:hypothetical protein
VKALMREIDVIEFFEIDVGLAGRDERNNNRHITQWSYRSRYTDCLHVWWSHRQRCRVRTHPQREDVSASHTPNTTLCPDACC